MNEKYQIIVRLNIFDKYPNNSNLNFKNEIIKQNYYYYFPLIVKPCLYGQVIKNNNSLPFCEFCPPGSFSLHSDDECKTCILGANCSKGILLVDPGFWRYQLKIYSCSPAIIGCLYFFFKNFYYTIYKKRRDS